MNFFAFDPRKLALIVFVIIIPLISLNMMQEPGEAPWYTKPVTFVSGYTQMAYSSFSSSIRSTVSLYFSLIDIKKDNRTLQQERAELRTRLSDLQELRSENERLNQLIGFKTQSKMELVAARVVSHDLLSSAYSTILINRGTLHGVKPNQAVITAEGIVGSTLDAQPHFSQVLVLNDRYAVIDARVQRSRARGLIEGKSQELCLLRLKYLERGDDVQIGDLIVTSGLDGIYPKGFPIGTVSYVEKKPYGISQNVEVKPIVDPFRLEEIFVVIKNEELDKSEEIPAKLDKDKKQDNKSKEAPKKEIKKDTKKQ